MRHQAYAVVPFVPMLALGVPARRVPRSAVPAGLPHRLLLASALCVIITGCASTGPPRPPSLHLPQSVRDLSATRYGEWVELRFTVPTLSTDRQSLAGKHGAGVLRAQLCRQSNVAGSRCAVVAAQAVAAGEVVTVKDSLPATLLTGPAQLLRYRVVILNAQGRSAADAPRAAVTLTGSTPGAVRGLLATTTSRGVQLTWMRDRDLPADTRILLQTEPAGRHYAVAGDPGGTVDTHAKEGETVTYTLVRTRTVSAAVAGSLSDIVVNGEPATVTVTRSADIFPPASPTGLVAVALQLQGKPSRIDLSWEPNTEPDLAGYLLYRTDGTGQPILLTPAPIPAIAFSDAAVQAGHNYTYTLRAVDAAGNRSAVGAAAQEAINP